MVVRRLKTNAYGVFRKLKRQLNSFKITMESSNKKAIEELANFVALKAKQYAPEFTGELKRNIYVEPGGDPHEKFVVAYGRQARPMEFGFARHPVSLFRHPELAAWAQAKLGLLGFKKSLWVGGPTTPGGRGYHYMLRAFWDASQDATLRRMFGDKIDQAMRSIFR
ncbi:MAG TPA: HK97 gp10 family phage protein [Candidatus Bathyarchaeota archaeon]|nr:HK97 gp10 family phage protein [Candidatus Bathyarchaeota archaeon]HEX69582.1 HK97 gp10 family phage protein [Candidatus Bathyarchaeota archaeon]